MQKAEDGGFVMCAKHDIPEIHAKSLMKDMYDEHHKHEYDTLFVSKCCSKLAKTPNTKTNLASPAQS